MFFLLPAANQRPSILEGNKDARYHAEFARYCMGQVNSSLHNNFIDKIKRNKNYYKGNQWIDQEDVESFLKDDDNQDRNRLAIHDNIIRPMVEQYRGNAIRMNLNFRMKSISPQAINRRESKLAEVKFMSEQANRPDNPFGPAMKKQFPIGDNEGETVSIFNNTYVDDFVKAMNGLARYVADRNTFEDKQFRVAEEMALSGLGVMKGFEYSGHLEFKVVPSETFFWDRSAREYDLSDSAFMGEVEELTASEIFEQNPDMDPDHRKEIDNYCKFFSGEGRFNEKDGSFHSGKCPVYNVYWRDGRFEEFGYVRDEFGYEYLTKINCVYDGEEKPRYTDSDLIESKSPRARRIGLGPGRKKRRLYFDEIRVARIIPREVLASVSPHQNPENFHDVLLDWGIAPYQDTENIEFSSAKYPYKAHCWAYIDGEVMSPIDDAIDPQRFINRILSVAENHINNSRGSGMVYDKDMMEDEAEALRNMNQSKPVGIRARGKGIQNAVGLYDATIKNGTKVIFDIMGALKLSTQQMTGLNDALKGESTGSDQLVGVTQLMIQRGSLMQEPFYYGMTNVFKQCFQYICNVGKRIYIENDRNLVIAVGDDGAETIKLSKDMRAEDFRAFVKRENSDDILRTAADQMLVQLLQIGLIDQKRYANLWGRSTPEDVGVALRQYAMEKEEMNRMGQKQAQQTEAALMQKAEEEQRETQRQGMEAQAREDVKDITEKQFGLKQAAMNSLGKIAANNKKAENTLLKTSEEVLSQ